MCHRKNYRLKVGKLCLSLISPCSTAIGAIPVLDVAILVAGSSYSLYVYYIMSCIGIGNLVALLANRITGIEVAVNVRALAPGLGGVVVKIVCCGGSLKICSLRTSTVIEDNVCVASGDLIRPKAILAESHLLAGPRHITSYVPCVAIYLGPVCCIVNKNCGVSGSCVTSVTLAVSVMVAQCCNRLAVGLSANAALIGLASCQCAGGGVLCNHIVVITAGSLYSSGHCSTLKSDCYGATILCNGDGLVGAGICCAPSMILRALELIGTGLNVKVNLYVRIGICIVGHVVVGISGAPVGTAKTGFACYSPSLTCSRGSNNSHAHQECKHYEKSDENFACRFHDCFLS